MDTSKLLIGGLSSCLLVVVVCSVFVTRSPSRNPEAKQSIPETQETRLAQEHKVPGHQNVGLSSVTGTPAEGLTNSDLAGLREQIASLSENVNELRAQTSDLAVVQQRLDALMHNLALTVSNSKLKVPTYEEHQKALTQMKAEVEKQRSVVEAAYQEARGVARKLGLPESTVTADPSEVLVLPPGRDYSELSSYRAKLINAKKILEFAEQRFSEGRMIQTLPPVGVEQ